MNTTKICTGCNVSLELEKFSPRKDGVLARASRCIECRRIDRRKIYKNSDNRNRRDRWKNNPSVRASGKIASQKYRAINKEILAEKSKQRHRAKRIAIIQRYGGCCECCSENRIEFLSIDHVNGGGNAERRIIGGSSGVNSKLFKSTDRLDGYRVLCHNCNMAVAFYGTCPHKLSTAV